MMSDVTPPLDKFRRAYAEDDNEWWSMACGHHQNLFEAACEQIDEARTELERIRNRDEWVAAERYDRVVAELESVKKRIAEALPVVIDLANEDWRGNKPARIDRAKKALAILADVTDVGECTWIDQHEVFTKSGKSCPRCRNEVAK